MSTKDKILKEPGFAIVNIFDLSKFKSLRDIFLKRIGFEKKLEMKSFRKKLSSMKNSEINRVMLSLLSFNEASEIIIESCKDTVEELCGKELLIQRRANTIFNLPGKEQRRQWPHYELMSGISPYTFVLWAPFHDLEDDGGVFYLNQQKSFEFIKLEHKKGLVNGPEIFNKFHNQKPAKLKFGEAIIFNPFILHGNIGFSSDLSRVACSVRFQNKHKPLMQKNSDFFKLYTLK